ncbi:hypothetical protein [uncultured Streptomyces sp.]|uniref:hypothetical protein n=1 Tax=uncultured Streptomyces sp. TaxID=174707 RepID=UPI00263869F7|nr:hypothetical protein [uncultured Streptomyces sp.]
MPLSPARSSGTGGRLGVQEAEAALVEHYPRLVRLAHLVLPPSLGRHRRVLAAHAAVQRALPGPRAAPRPPAAVPAQRSGVPSDASGQTGGPASAYAWMRLRVLRAALAYERRPGWWPERLPAPAALRPAVPVVRGLRLFPRAGGADELALDRALSEVPAAVRAALALRLLESLDDDGARALLGEAGARDPAGAVRAAASVGGADHAAVAAMLRSPEFDPCTVQTRPSDLLRRRHRMRAAAAAVALCAVAGVLAVSAGRGEGPSPSGTGVGAYTPLAGVPAEVAAALDPGRLLRAPAGQWADTSRVDFTAWAPRGDRADDRELLGRALRTWARRPAGAAVTTTPGASTAPPVQPPRLLYAGEVDGAAVVLFHDGGVRVVRYAEPAGRRSGADSAALDFARVDDADVTTAAALVVSRTGAAGRFLLAPWIAESSTRDLLAPDTPARPLGVGPDGVTAAVGRPGADGGCDAWPAVQLRSSGEIVEKHAFLVTDLGDLTPVHLTHTPAPGAGQPARQPREATGTEALAGWSRTACSLRALSGSGVRAVNNWEFARQRLPGTPEPAAWVCTRADTWRGPGRVLVQFVRPGASAKSPAAVVADRQDTALCSRFGQHVLAGTHWRSPAGDWYVLAAGSRAVRRIDASGAVTARAEGTTLAVRAPQDARVRLTSLLPDGSTLPAVE